MPGKRRDREAFAIDHRGAPLCTRAMVRNGLDFAAQLAVMDCRGQHALSRVADAFRVDRFAPAELGAHSDFSQSLGFARQQAGRDILIDHDQRRAEPARGLFDQTTLLWIVEWMIVGAQSKSRYVAA